MTQYSLTINKKGTIMSLQVVDADPNRFPVRNLKGNHFSRLLGSDCRKDLSYMLRETDKTRKPSSFRTFLPPKGSNEGPLLEWTILPKSATLLNIFFPARYVLVGKEVA
jgi:hypothetical protein